MAEEQLPTAPLPPDADLRAEVKAIFDDVGAESLTMKILLKRLALKFKLDFKPQRQMLDAMVLELIRDPVVSKKLAVAAQKAKKEAERKKKLEGKGKKAKKSRGGDDAGADRKRGKKEKDDYEGPKKPQSAFFIFTGEKRPVLMAEMKEKDGKVDIATLGKTMGDMWKAMSPEEKAPYEKKAEEDKARYEKDLADFKAGTWKPPAAGGDAVAAAASSSSSSSSDDDE